MTRTCKCLRLLYLRGLGETSGFGYPYSNHKLNVSLLNHVCMLLPYCRNQPPNSHSLSGEVACKSQHRPAFSVPEGRVNFRTKVHVVVLYEQSFSSLDSLLHFRYHSRLQFVSSRVSSFQMSSNLRLTDYYSTEHVRNFGQQRKPAHVSHTNKCREMACLAGPK